MTGQLRSEERRELLKMGCSSSKAHTNVAMRVLEYQHLAATENEGLSLLPAMLDTEEWRDGLIRNVLRVLLLNIHCSLLGSVFSYIDIGWGVGEL